MSLVHTVSTVQCSDASAHFAPYFDSSTYLEIAIRVALLLSLCTPSTIECSDASSQFTADSYQMTPLEISFVDVLLLSLYFCCCEFSSYILSLVHCKYSTV